MRSLLGSRLVQFAYDLLLTVIAPIAIPYWAVRSVAKGHSLRSLLEGFGWIPVPKRLTARGSIWFHAVSVGEVQSCLPLLSAIRSELPRTPIYVSTGTATGRKLAAERLGDIATTVFRAPVDLRWCVARVFARIRPDLLIVAETELWPNYFFQARRFGVPVVIVNGRISDRSAGRYLRLRFLFRAALESVNMFLVQSAKDYDRFVAIGAHPDRTMFAGNLKYDFDPRQSADRLSADISDLIERCAPNLVFVAGSTREGEERMLLPSLAAMAEREPGLLAVVAPRHPHRFDEAAGTLSECRLPVVRRSELDPADPPELPAVLLLDSLGELAAMYSRADLVFVGGSLNGWGGHNVLEPAAFGKPVVVGPHMQNFRQIAGDLLEVGGLVQVGDESEMKARLTELATSADERSSIGKAATAPFASNRGASKATAKAALAMFWAYRIGARPSALAYLALWLPSLIWKRAARFREQCYANGDFGRVQLDTPVISVGNITAGGTGKTPTVAWLVERLADRGRTAAVLTRGYGRTGRGTRILETSSIADPKSSGDEPAMLLRRFRRSAPRTVVAVGADRSAAGQLVIERFEPDFLVLDDGYQHLRLVRPIDIVLLDYSRPWDNGCTLPLGRLREPLTALWRANVVILTRCGPPGVNVSLEDTVRRMNPNAEVFWSRISPVGLTRVGTGSEHDLSAVRGMRVAAFCGIGYPGSFFDEVRDLECTVVLERTFRDHHRYSDREVASLFRVAAKNGAEALLTTEKDAMNLPGITDPELPIFALRIELAIDGEERLMRLVLESDDRPRRARGRSHRRRRRRRRR